MGACNHTPAWCSDPVCRERAACLYADGAALRLETLPLGKPIARAVVDIPAPDGPHRYHFTEGTAVTVATDEGQTVRIGPGWLAITEAEYAQLRHPPAVVDLAGLSDAQVRELEAEFAAAAVTGAPILAETSSPIPDRLDDDLRAILGTLCFEANPLAFWLRVGGAEIPYRAEDEQAHVIHWLLKLWLKHGADWKRAGNAEIKAIRQKRADEAVA